MAAPHVAGVAALIVGQRGHVGPTALKTILENTSVDILKPGADPAGKARVRETAATQ
jgi:subtilisin family serine protease